MDKIHTRHKVFVDQYNRERIFNGINMVFKGDDSQTGEKNYIANWNETQFKWLVDNGFNLIRLGIIWDGVEHEMGVYNEVYLDWIESMLDLCEKYGIYAFIDMHQDLYSNKYSDGAPDWATITDGQKHVDGEMWSDAYLFSGAVQRAFDNFWANVKVNDGLGLQEYYANMWAHVVERFKKHNALIGYDLLNEPYPGKSGVEIFNTLLNSYAKIAQKDLSPQELMKLFLNPEKKYELLKTLDNVELYSAMIKSAMPLVSQFDTNVLAKFYKKITHAIRKVTNDGIIMMENCYFSNLGIQCNIPPIVNNGGIKKPLQAYVPHAYDLVVDSSEIVNASNNRIDVIFDSHKKVQNRLNIPVIMGEWGAHGMYEKGLEHIIHIIDMFDKNKWSNTYWCYHNNIENAPVMKVLCRPYPQAVCGEILNYHYDRKDNSFSLEWKEDANIDMPSVIYLHQKPKFISLNDEVKITSVSETSNGTLLTIPNRHIKNRSLKVMF